MLLDFENKTKTEVSAWIDERCLELAQNDKNKLKPLVIVSYRGQWWPFCLRYLEDFSECHERIKSLGGISIMITSDPKKKVQRVIDGIDGKFDYSIADPKHHLTRVLRERNLPSPVITGKNGDKGYTSSYHTNFASKRGHVEGLLQPSTFAFTPELSVLFEWRIIPKLMNFHGAADRPDIKAIVELLEQKSSGKYKLSDITTLKALQKIKSVAFLRAWDWRSLLFLLKGLPKKKISKL